MLYLLDIIPDATQKVCLVKSMLNVGLRKKTLVGATNSAPVMITYLRSPQLPDVILVHVPMSLNST